MTEFFIGLGLAMLGFTLYWYVESVYGEELVRWLRKNFK